MKKEYTILHISDLHKSEDCDYDNLFASLIDDCERYTSEGIPSPEIIVVSGDLIQGSRKNNVIEAEKEIMEQYEEVRLFLDKIVDYFLHGDKRRIILVPGNHDMFKCLSLSSMKKEEYDNDNLTKDIRDKRSKMLSGDLRWNWSDLSFYSINDAGIYDSRFCLFTKFYNSFYSTLYPPRIWEDPCDRTSSLIDLVEYRVCFLCLNSCYQLDGLRDVGSIFPTALTCRQRKLMQLSKRGSLIIGVWHHHTSGLPYETNYLDYRILNSLIGHKIKIGLYGHQHKSSIINEFRDVSQNESILLLSSGSLYGDRKELNTGIPRQYSLLTLNFDDKHVNIKFRVRKDPTSYVIPMWTEGQIGNSASTIYTQNMDIQALNVDMLIAEIQDYVKRTEDYEHAWIYLKEIFTFNPDLCRKFMDSYISKVPDNEFIINNIARPDSDNEYIVLLNAAINLKKLDIIEMLRNDERFNNIKDVRMNYLKEQLQKLI